MLSLSPLAFQVVKSQLKSFSRKEVGYETEVILMCCLLLQFHVTSCFCGFLWSDENIKFMFQFHFSAENFESGCNNFK